MALDKIDNLDLGLEARNKINLAFDTIDALMLASVSSSGYSAIEDEGILLPNRDTINFVGSGVSASDIGGKTTITIESGGHIIEDEGTPLTNRTTLNFVGTGVSVADSGGKTVVTIPTPVVSYAENITYTTLLNLFNTSALEVGKQYILTDFATKHFIPNSGGTVNTGSTESLVLLALAVNKLDHVAKSLTYPKDIIHYELVDSSTAGGDKGRIYYREDPVINISTYYDWRNVKFRRFRNAQTLNFVVNVFPTPNPNLNLLGSKIIGSTSGAVGYVIGGTGANILRVVNLSTDLFIGGEIITHESGTTRTTNTVADYTIDADTHVSNGRSSTDVYTFVDSSATGMYNIKIGPLSSAGPTDKLNNITFLAGSHDVYFHGDAYNCSMSTCYNFKSNGIFYNNYFRGGVSDFFISTDFYDNKFCNNSFRNTVTANFLSNVISGGFDNNTIGGYYFGLNSIAYGFRYNNSLVRFASNTIDTPNVRNNIIECDVQTQTFAYSATEITQTWNKRLVVGSDGVYYLEYFSGGSLVYVDPLIA